MSDNKTCAVCGGLLDDAAVIDGYENCTDEIVCLRRQRDEARMLKVPPSVDQLIEAQMARSVALAERDAAFARVAEVERERDEAIQRPAFDFVAHLHRQRAFSLRTFGTGTRAAGVVDHIRKELVEIERDPADLTEWIDVVLLACDGAWRQGYEPEQIAQALAAKLAKNEARVWPDWRTADPNKAIEHKRDGAE